MQRIWKNLSEKLDDWNGDTSGRELSRELRQKESPSLRRRRRVAALSLVSMASMGLISLYQMGLLKRLPDLPGGIFDANKVDASPEAYEKLGMPDGVLGLRSYASTLALAATGDDDRAHGEPWLPIMLAAKTLFDAYQAGRLSVQQWTEHRAFCIWCLVAAGATLAAATQALPEAVEAARGTR